jgi:hypothetical protein
LIIDFENHFFLKLKTERERQDKRVADEEKINATVRSAKLATTTKSSTATESSTNQVFRSGIGKYISNQV